MNKKIAYFFLLIFISITLLYLNILFCQPNDVSIKLLEGFQRIQIGKNIESFVTIYTVYFKFPRSKHPHSAYDKWTENFLTSISSPLVIFTDSESFLKFKTIVLNHNLSVTFYIAKDIWEIVSQIERWRNKSYINDYKNKQWNLDTERRFHNPNLYAVWNSKHFMGKLVAEENVYKSDFFIYTDMAAWRVKNFNNWPNVEFAKQVHSYLNNSGLYAQIYRENMKSFNPKGLMIEGGFFAGSKIALTNLANAFYKIHDEWLEDGLFIGKDQTIMNLMTFKENRNLIKRLRTWGYGCFGNYNRWFFYQNFFSHNNCSLSLKSSIL